MNLTLCPSEKAVLENNINEMINAGNILLDLGAKNILLKDCQLSKFAIFSNTSAGIEAVNNGLIAIWADLTSINLSPLTESQKKFFYPSNNFKSFRKNINKVYKLNKKEFTKKQKLQIMISQNIYSKINIKNIKNILKKN